MRGVGAAGCCTVVGMVVGTPGYSARVEVACCTNHSRDASQEGKVESRAWEEEDRTLVGTSLDIFHNCSQKVLTR